MNGFKWVFTSLLVLSVLGASVAYGDSILSLTLNPSNGAVSGGPGQIVGWGFTLTNTSDLVAVITSADYCGAVISSPCSTPLGGFTDFIAQFNFSVVNARSSLIASFNPSSRTGIGSYRINTGAAPGSSFLGQVVLTYDTYTNNTFGNQTAADIRLATPASVSVTATPEISSSLLLSVGIVLLLVMKRAITPYLGAVIDRPYIGESHSIRASQTSPTVGCVLSGIWSYHGRL